MELAAALKEGPGYLSSIPVSFDGSCNGLQHLCAMTRASEGSLVSLTPNVEPQDIYQEVAKRVRARIENDDSEADFLDREQWLKRDIDRKTVKQDVMTYFYSSTERGMIDRRLEAGKEFSVEGAVYRYKEASLDLSKYFTKHVRAAIEEVVDLPAKAMTFLQELARLAQPTISRSNGFHL
jgi:DNA-directed RNA polymerase